MNFLNPYQRARLLLLCASILSFLAFWFSAAIFHIPPYPGHQSSLLISSPYILPLLILFIVLAVSVAAGTAIAGMVRFNAGLLTATLGLSALSFRGGDPRHTILASLSSITPAGIFLRFFLELLIYSILLGLAWYLLRSLYTKGKLRDRETPGMSGENGDLTSDLPSLAVQFVITAMLIMLLAQSEAKQQAMAAIFIGAWGASAFAHTFFPTGPRSWYWLPPLLVGLCGFALAALSPPSGIFTADVRGLLSGLYRPMPLDYASMGPAGAILGHWMSRRWQRDRTTAQSATP